MRYLTLLTVLCVSILALGGLSTLGAGAPADSIWLKAVALSGKNGDLVPGLMKMHMQEVDKHGEPKNDEKYHEVWTTLSLGEDGEVEYEMIRTIENGKDITDEEKAKGEKEKAREKEEDGEGDEDSDSREMESYNPFDPESQGRISTESIGDGW